MLSVEGIAPPILPSTALPCPLEQKPFVSPGFGFAGGDTSMESGKGCSPPNPNQCCSSRAAAFAHRVVQQERGVWRIRDFGAVYRETRGSRWRERVSGDTDAVNSRLRLQPPPSMGTSLLLSAPYSRCAVSCTFTNLLTEKISRWRGSWR